MPIPAPISAMTEKKATIEKRGTTLTSAGTQPVNVITSRPISPPIQTEPAAMWIQSTGMATPRGEVWPAWPVTAGARMAAPAASNAPARASSPPVERRGRSGRSSQIATAPA